MRKEETNLLKKREMDQRSRREEKTLGRCSAEKNPIKSVLKLQFSFFLLTLLCHDAHNVQQRADEERQDANERQVGVVGRKTFMDKSHDLVPLNCHDVPAQLVSHLR